MKRVGTVKLIPRLSIDGRKTAMGATVVIDVVLTIILMAIVGALVKVQNLYVGFVVIFAAIPTAVWKMHVWFQICDCYKVLG